MHELFYKDPYRRAFEAVVTDVRQGKKGLEVALEDTIFYPEGGGQPSDQGKIGTANVSYVHREGGKIWHMVDAELEKGVTYPAGIDWQRRFRNMQNHTAEHILSGLVHKKFGFDNVGFHMDGKVVTVDFNGVLTPEDLAGIELETNRAVWSNIPVVVSFPTAEELERLEYRSKIELSGEVRIVSIEGCDRCACCGTHVASSGEVGLVKVLTVAKHRGGTRMTMATGISALEDYSVKVEQAAKVSELLSSKQDEIAAATENLLRANETLSHQLTGKTLELLELKASGIPDAREITFFVDNVKPAELKKLCSILAETKPSAERIVVLSKGSQKGQECFNYVIFSRNEDIRKVSLEINKKLSGRGGGRDGYAQGTFGAAREQIEEVLGNS